LTDYFLEFLFSRKMTGSYRKNPKLIEDHRKGIYVPILRNSKIPPKMFAEPTVRNSRRARAATWKNKNRSNEEITVPWAHCIVAFAASWFICVRRRDNAASSDVNYPCCPTAAYAYKYSREKTQTFMQAY